MFMSFRMRVLFLALRVNEVRLVALIGFTVKTLNKVDFFCCSFSKLSKSHWHLKSQNNYSTRTEYLPVQQPKSHFCWKTDSNYPSSSSGVRYHINYIYSHSLLYAALERYSRYFRKKTFCHPLGWPTYNWLVLILEWCYLKMISHPFGNIVHIIAQDFYLLYQRHEKNQTVKITVLFSISTKINPSINIPIVSKNSRYIYCTIIQNQQQ